MLPFRNLHRNIQKFILQPHYALQAFSRRFRSYLAYLFLDGYSTYPETISLFLNYRCNLRCPMCGQWGDSGAFKDFSAELLRQDLPVELVRKIITEVKDFKPAITLFGGEPMMHKGWIEILKIIKEARLRCNIVTNGTLIQRYLEPILDLQLDEIIFSLDGPREIHDQMRGKKGTFDRAIQGYELLREKKKQKHLTRPAVNINCTIFELNYKRLPEVVQIAEHIGASSITFHHLLFMNKKMVEEHNKIFHRNFEHRCHEWYGFVRESLPKIDVKELIRQLRALQQRPNKVKINVYPNFTDEEIVEFYNQFEFTPKSYPNRCLSLWMAAYIFPNGDVRPYHSMDYTLGNVAEKSFKEIWNDERYLNYRRFVKKIRRFPVCSKGCTEFYRY